jgi:hypothetical protein
MTQLVQPTLKERGLHRGITTKRQGKARAILEESQVGTASGNQEKQTHKSSLGVLDFNSGQEHL